MSLLDIPLNATALRGSMPPPVPFPSGRRLWNPGIRSALREAQQRQTAVLVRACLPYGGRLADILLQGMLEHVADGEALLHVVRSEELSARSALAAFQCDFFFCLERITAPDVRNVLGYRGRGVVLRQVEFDEETRHVRLWLSGHCSIRRLRRDRRIPWMPDRHRQFSLTPLPEMPLAREDIMRELHHSCPAPDAGGAQLDISAGGACVCTETPSSMSLRCNAAFLFFLLPDPLPPAGAPFVFLARQLGRHRELCRNGRALRLLFTHELIWPAAGMTIADIAANGSPRLRAYLKGINNTPESWHPFALWRDTPAGTAIPVDEDSALPDAPESLPAGAVQDAILP